MGRSPFPASPAPAPVAPAPTPVPAPMPGHPRARMRPTARPPTAAPSWSAVASACRAWCRMPSAWWWKARWKSTMIHATELSVAQGGVFRGEVEVEDAEIGGTIDGTLIARGSLVVRATGKMIGTARCRRLQVEEGGQITGRIEMITEPAARPRPRTPLNRPPDRAPPGGGVTARSGVTAAPSGAPPASRCRRSGSPRRPSAPVARRASAR